MAVDRRISAFNPFARPQAAAVGAASQPARSPMYQVNNEQPNFSTGGHPSTANVAEPNTATGGVAQPSMAAQPAVVEPVQPAIETVGQTQGPVAPAKAQVMQNPVVNGQPGAVVTNAEAQPNTAAVEGQEAVDPADAAAIKRNPYQWIMNKFAPQEPPKNLEEQRRREQNQAKIAGMLGLFTGIGNMLVTSSNRFGRAVTSPDFAKPVTEGIAAREKQRRENEALAREQAYKDQQLELQRDKMKADAAEKAWNHSFKQSQEAAKNKHNEALLKLKADNEKANRESREKMHAAGIKSREGIAAAARSQALKIHEDKKKNGLYGRGGSKNDTTPIYTGNGRMVDVPKSKWSSSTARSVYKTAYEEAAAEAKKSGASMNWFEDKGWAADATKMTDDDMMSALADYFYEHPNSAAVEAVNKLANDKPYGFEDGDSDEDDLDFTF